MRQLHSVIENPTATVFSSSSYLVLFSVCVWITRGADRDDDDDDEVPQRSFIPIVSSTCFNLPTEN